MFRDTRGRALGMIAAVALVAGACGGSAATTAPTAAPPTAATSGAPETPAAEMQTIKIGISGPFSGPNARTGEEMKNASEMAFDAINWTVGNYKIEPVYIDDQSDPAKGAAAYEQAIVSQKIIAGMLGWHSSVAVADMEVLAKYKIPHFFEFGATSVVNQKFKEDTAKYGYLTTKAWPDPVKLSISYVTALNDAIAAGSWTPAEKKVAIYCEDTDWGRSYAAGFKTSFEETGWTVVSEDFVPTTQTDFSALIARYKSQNVPLLAGTISIPASASAFVKAVDDAGLKSMVVLDGLGWIGEWYKLTGKSSNYVLDSIPGWTTDAAKKFAADFEAKYGFAPGPSAAGLSYDFANFFIKVLEATLADQGSITSETLYKEAQEKLWTGQLTYTDGIIMKSYDYNAETLPDMVLGADHYIFPVLQYMNGEGIVVWPDAFKTGTIQTKP